MGVAYLGQALSRGTAGRDCRQAPLHVSAVLLDVACYEGIDRGSVVGIEVAATDEVVRQGAGLVERPGLEGGHQLALVDQPVLKGQQSKQKVAVSGDSGHGSGLL